MFTKDGGTHVVTRTVGTVLAVLALAACGGDDEEATSGTGGEQAAAKQDLGLNKPGTVTVGMNLQFKPEMYLKNGEPAGYDVDLLKELAPAMGNKLDIQNLDFNGLIPGLQSKKFDMVSVGLSATPERKQAVDFSRAYVPYALVLAVGNDDSTEPTTDAFNVKGKTLTALQGSTGETLAKELFSDAAVKGFPDQNAAFLEVATGRADGVVVEDYLLAQFQKSNPDELKKAEFPEPLDVQYGSYAVQKGNTKLVKYLDEWICKAQTDGTLERIYKKNFEVDEFPPMPAGC